MPVLLRLLALGLVVVLAGSLPASATAEPEVARRTANPVTPGNFTGYGFDQCLAPTQAAMDAWLTSSPFWAVGIYISGNSRHCRNQPNLTPDWVSQQLAKGWRLLPITLGPQAFCNPRYPKYKDDPVISRDPATARAQGQAEAGTAVAAANALGIAPGSTLWYDIEAFDIKNASCRTTTLQFLSGWTERIRALGFVSGTYSSGASGIKAIDDARVGDPAFVAPDMLWVADWSGKPNIYTGKWVRAGAWLPGRRVHQYRGGHDEVHGGVRINIDSNFLDVGQGSTAPTAPRRCGGTVVDYTAYPKLAPGLRNRPMTKAAQCLLKKQGHFTGKVRGRYTKRTARAVAAFRLSVGLPASPVLSKKAWVALLSHGAQPIMKYGSAGEDVRRLQRAINASSVKPKATVTGTFAAATAAAVKTYQAKRDLPATGVVTPALWAMLQKGRR